MSWETVNPVAVVDEESDPPGRVVIRYETVAKAEWYIAYLHEHGGTVTRAKIERGGYGIDVPEEMQ